jgi:hypothetical protein
VRPGERNKLFEMRLALLLETVTQMEEDFRLSNGRTLMPSACEPVIAAARKLEEAMKGRVP